MDSSNELTSGIRQRARAKKSDVESTKKKIEVRYEFLASSYLKLIELLSIPPGLRELAAAEELETMILECKGSGGELFEEVRLFEESYSSLLNT